MGSGDGTAYASMDDMGRELWASLKQDRPRSRRPPHIVWGNGNAEKVDTYGAGVMPWVDINSPGRWPWSFLEV